MIDPKAFGEELAAIVKAATEPLVSRISALELALSSQPVAKDGRDGADADPQVVADIVHDRIKGDIAAIQAAVDAIPEAPEFPELPDIPAMIEIEVSSAIKNIPVGKDGCDGDVGASGPKGERGPDGIGLAGALIDRSGNLVVTLTSGETRTLGQVIGAPGRDGADGLGFEDMEFTSDVDGRPIARFHRGGEVKSVRLPCLIDRGVFKSDREYLRGDAVSFGGGLWIAQKDAPDGRPDSGGDGWRLAVKKGRDGRDGETRKGAL